MKRIFTFGIITLFALMMSPPAESSSLSIVETYADWSSFSVSGGAYSWLGGNDGSVTVADADNDSEDPAHESEVVHNLGSSASTATVTNAEGRSYTTADLVAAEAEAQADGTTTIDATASASTHRKRILQMSEDATLTFSIPYTFYQNLSTTLAGEYASAYSEASLMIVGGVPGADWGVWDMDNPLASVSDSMDNDTVGTYQDGGTFSLSYALTNGEYYWIELHLYDSVHAYSPEQTGADNPTVPEPMTMALFGSGLLGAVGLRRKRS